MNETLHVGQIGCNWYQNLAPDGIMTPQDLFISIGLVLKERDARKETMEWVAEKLRQLEKLHPHSWDRSTLTELRHALEDSPKLLNS